MNNESRLIGLDRKSAEYVTLHAKLKKKRGRFPSIAYCGIRNPREALRYAETVIRMGNGKKKDKNILMLRLKNEELRSLISNGKLFIRLRSISLHLKISVGDYAADSGAVARITRLERSDTSSGAYLGLKIIR